MVDMSAIASAVSALKGAQEILSAMVGIRDGGLFQNKLIELNRLVIAAQESTKAAHAAELALIERVRDLESQVRKIEAWGAEKQRYEMAELYNGAIAHVVKEAVRGAEPVHYICSACYQQDKKSVLQGSKSYIHGNKLTCPACRLEIIHSYDPE